MSGRIEINVCCAALLAGSATLVDPEVHVPVVLGEVTAVLGVEGTHSDTDAGAAFATAPPEIPSVVTIIGSIRRLTTNRRITHPFQFGEHVRSPPGSGDPADVTCACRARGSAN
jgi:hypothetical protein